MDDQTEAWNRLYRTEKRPWKGVSSAEFPFSSGDSVLDIGCGNGKTSSALLEIGCSVTGIDISHEAVNFCSSSFPEMRVVCASAVSLPFDDEEFDGVAMVHVTEHLTEDDIVRSKNEILRVLRKNGILLIRSFTSEDMRARSGTMVVKGNGIRYIYRNENDIIGMFSDLNVIRSDVIKEQTKFGETRSRMEIVLQKR